MHGGTQSMRDVDVTSAGRRGINFTRGRKEADVAIVGVGCRHVSEDRRRAQARNFKVPGRIRNAGMRNDATWHGGPCRRGEVNEFKRDGKAKDPAGRQLASRKIQENPASDLASRRKNPEIRPNANKMRWNQIQPSGTDRRSSLTRHGKLQAS